MTAPNVELKTELQALIRRDYPLVDPTILQPFSANPLVDGEWLELAASYKLQRGTGQGVNPLVFMVHTERGRSDTQAIGKTNVLYLGQYEADTKIFDPTGLVQGDPLSVQDVTIGGLVKRGLKKATTGGAIVGYVSKIYPGNAKVRFIHMATTLMA